MEEALARDTAVLAVLQATWAEGSADTLPLTRARIRIGRSERNHVVVGHPAISGEHLEIRLEQGAAYVRDLDSANGTFLDGRRMPAGEILAVPSQARIRLHNCLELRLLPPDSRMPRVVMPERVYLGSPPQPGLIILRNDGPMQRVPLAEGRTMLGRGSGNHVVIDSPAVSGRHAEIVYRGADGYSIIDLDSLNGLTHEGRRIASKVLHAGDRLYIADQVRIQFQPDLSFFTQAPGTAKAERQEAPSPAHNLSVCIQCGATNYGPQKACLRCQARLG